MSELATTPAIKARPARKAQPARRGKPAIKARSGRKARPAKRGKIPASPATIWRWVREDKFPKPFKLGESITVWDLDEVDQFIAKRYGAA
jgi:hypothetical protein